MAEIFSEPGDDSHEYIKHQIDNPDLEFHEAEDAAKKIALTKCSSCMVLSWKNGKTGEFFPWRECGMQKEPAWIHYARTRGADLTVDINDGEYIFMILKIE